MCVLVTAGACNSGDDGPPADDGADEVTDDMTDGTDVDAPPSAVCTGSAYEPCTTNDQCASMNCHEYRQVGFSVCTQACTPNSTTECPAQNGVAVPCNNMGLCRPEMPNSCTR